MTAEIVRQLLLSLDHPDPAQRETARQALLDMDEDAIDPLSDAFFAGVNEALGVAILEVVGAIGGPDALLMLRNVYNFEDRRMVWKRTAGLGLLHNRDNLDQHELEALLADKRLT
jgi:hypothetical protein